MDSPEKFRFSGGMDAELGVEDPKSCVIVVRAVAVELAGQSVYQGETLEAWLCLSTCHASLVERIPVSQRDDPSSFRVYNTRRQ